MKLIALIAVLALTGCATVSSWFASPNSAAYITAAVDIAVATAEAKGISAAQINGIAKLALAADSGTTTSLSAVAGLVDSQIGKLKLSTGDQAAADILVSALSAAITAKVNGNASVASAQAAAAVVLNAVVTATQA